MEEILLHLSKDCSLNTIHNRLKSLEFVFKNTLKASEQEREGIIIAKSEWNEFQRNTASNRLIFLAETEIKTNIMRLYDHAFQGARFMTLSRMDTVSHPFVLYPVGWSDKMYCIRMLS